MPKAHLTSHTLRPLTRYMSSDLLCSLQNRLGEFASLCQLISSATSDSAADTNEHTKIRVLPNAIALESKRRLLDARRILAVWPYPICPRVPMLHPSVRPDTDHHQKVTSCRTERQSHLSRKSKVHAANTMPGCHRGVRHLCVPQKSGGPPALRSEKVATFGHPGLGTRKEGCSEVGAFGVASRHVGHVPRQREGGLRLAEPACDIDMPRKPVLCAEERNGRVPVGCKRCAPSMKAALVRTNDLNVELVNAVDSTSKSNLPFIVGAKGGSVLAAFKRTS